MDARPSRLLRRAAATMMLVALLAGSTACSTSGAGSTPAADPAAPTVGEAPSVPSGEAGQPTVSDATQRSACLGVQKVFLQLAVASARWDPVGDPFNAETADALAPLAHQLRDESRSVTRPRLRMVVDRNADALAALAAAMHSGRQQGVAAALAKSRTAYAALPNCARRDGRRTSTSHSAQTRANEPAHAASTGAQASEQTSVVDGAANDPGCKAAKAVYSRIGTVTTSWDLNADPFDSDTAAGFRTIADGLKAAALAAKRPAVANKVKSNEAAFQHLADAMAAKDLDGVNNGVSSMQQTAVTLAATCPLT